jgi:hypothetical protein
MIRSLTLACGPVTPDPGLALAADEYPNHRAPPINPKRKGAD